MIQSQGALVLSDTTPSYARTNYYPNTGLNLTGLHSSYGAIYRNQLWVYVVVSKRARATARLPLKVYRRSDVGRMSAADSPYARLLARPNRKMDSYFFWEWTSSTKDVYGEAMWAKVRGSDGRPSELWPMHPSLVQVHRIPNEVTGETETFYAFAGGVSSGAPILLIPERDVVHFRGYNPDTTLRGMSSLEPLRQTLVNEDAARRATSAFWVNGARPGVALSHPGNLTQAAAERLKAQWNSVAGGVDKTGATVVLEEGMKPEILTLSAEEAQYIETRKLNREEVCAAYDVPPPVVHILDRATFSNITEQMRSMYRDTMAPHIGSLEATLEHSLRPDFGDDALYAEFLMDEVLRGTFEERADKIQAAINSAQLTPNEGRALDNRPALPGGDRLYINSTMVPIEAVPSRPAPPMRKWSGQQVRTLMSRIGRASSLTDVDAVRLSAGLDDADVIVAMVGEAKSMDDLKARIHNMKGPDDPIELLAGAVTAMATRSHPPAPVVTVNQPAPVVNVNTPDVHVTTPPVTVNTPDVHVDARTTVEPVPVTVSAPKSGTKTIHRDKAGNITHIEESGNMRTVHRDKAGNISRIEED